ncbi:hypothetical protein DYB32_007532 [Aphanomyces invadans]|uniref:Uncharacterized protein n=1 Tax=Aphanomyces invadans TaxID=157072 RepID=A0A418ANL1_9STRA|nr:hypothetical protein DYB32_007532 [Aphanomyces invadans]
MRSPVASPAAQPPDVAVPVSSLDTSKLEEKFAAVNRDFARVAIKGKDDAMKLQAKVSDWRDDVSTLATHIASQLQFCKSLRTSKAMTLIPNMTTGDSANDGPGEVDIFRVLRSDIRSLYDYRLSYLPSMVCAGLSSTSTKKR